MYRYTYICERAKLELEQGVNGMVLRVRGAVTDPKGRTRTFNREFQMSADEFNGLKASLGDPHSASDDWPIG